MSRFILAHLIKIEREKRSWTQEQLAAVSGLDRRTIQRIESTGACSKETLMQLANALDTDVELLTSAKRMTEEDLQRFQKELSDVILLPQIVRGKDFFDIIAGTLQYMVDHEPCDTPAQAELVGSFLQSVRDYGDLYSDLEPHHIVDFSLTVDEELAQLRDARYVAFGDQVTLPVQYNGIRDNWRTAIVVVNHESNPSIVSTEDSKLLPIKLPAVSAPTDTNTQQAT